jgi:hypothetical protein
MLVPTREHDVIIPWDLHFRSRAEALGFLEAMRWTQPGALYDERYWTLGEAIRWIAERTPDAVDQAIASAEACEEATKALQEALEAGEVSSTACLPYDSVPRQVPPETWGTHTVCLRIEGGVLTPCVMHDSAEAQTLVGVRLRREEVLKKWPSVSEETRQLSTAAKESACRRWLTDPNH